MRRSDDQAIPTTASLGPVLSSLLSVADIASLAPLTYGDGTSIYVRTVRDYWVYRAASTATVDSITAVAHASGTGRWERLNIPHPSWALQTVWEIDTTTPGNDESAGTSQGTALATFAELRRRLGLDRGFVTKVAMTINTTGNFDANDPLLFDVWVTLGTRFTLSARRPAASFSGTVSAKTDLSTAGNGVTAKVTSTWTVATEIGRLVKDVTNGRYAWIIKDMGGGQAKVGIWLTLDEINGHGNSSSIGSGNTTVGAAIETYVLPTVAKVQGTVRGTAGTSSPFVIQGYDLTASAGTSRLFAACAQPSVLNCRTGTIRWGGSTWNLVNCHDTNSAPDLDYAPFLMYGGGYADTTIAPNSKAAGTTFDLHSGHLRQGASLRADRNTTLRVRTAFFEDCAADCIQLYSGSQILLSGSFFLGTGNTAGAIAVQGAGRVVCVGSFVAQCGIASAQDLKFNGAPTARAIDPTTGLPNAVARNLTFSNLDATYLAGGFENAVFDPVSGGWIGKSQV